MDFQNKRYLIRLYPILFRFLDDSKRFKKFSWLSIRIIKNPKDNRRESFKLYDPLRDIEILEEIPVKGKTDFNWKRRMQLIEPFIVPYRKLQENYETHSLGIIKLKEILNFGWKEEEKEWSKEELEKLMQMYQKDLFNESKKDLPLLEKVPYSFFYEFLDEECNKHKMQITDWEIYQLYRNLKGKYHTEEDILNKIRQKYFEEFLTNRDLYFVLGNHYRFRSKFFITGVLYPPKGWENLREPKSKFLKRQRKLF